ncbi:hypothetical protein WR25_21895 [Diploscapter pachys]|uniref:Polysaccharide biosynthesis domain-containing protein n=1 Tax=Diploscapter pachys TaxID=2018661 RepID=A0A2A2LYV8_9BILA|nr:hypothetical protein WR25_21895 [Diploscapter pachys]
MDDEIDYGDASKYINDESIEMAWAVKAAERANVHINLLMSCNTESLKLNNRQEQIQQAFREDFPNLDVKNVTEVELKQGEMREKWRQFCEKFKDVEDYSLGTLMRMDAAQAYSEKNSIVVPKTNVFQIIWLAIESTRNAEGLNERLKPSIAEDHKQNSAQL